MEYSLGTPDAENQAGEMLILKDVEKDLFHQNGLILVDRMIDDYTVDRLRDAFERRFNVR